VAEMMSVVADGHHPKFKHTKLQILLLLLLFNNPTTFWKSFRVMAGPKGKIWGLMQHISSYPMPCHPTNSVTALKKFLTVQCMHTTIHQVLINFSTVTTG